MKTKEKIRIRNEKHITLRSDFVVIKNEGVKCAGGCLDFMKPHYNVSGCIGNCFGVTSPLKPSPAWYVTFQPN